MANNELEIILTAVDNATAEIKKVKESVDSVEKATQETTKATEKAGKTIKDQFKEAGAQLKDFRRTMFAVTAALAIIISTTKEAAKYNREVKDTYDEFTKAIKELSATVGTMLSPALKGVDTLVRTTTTVIEAAIAGFIKLFSTVFTFWDNIGKGKNPFQAFKESLEIGNAAADIFIDKLETIRVRAREDSKVDQEANLAEMMDKELQMEQDKVNQLALLWQMYQNNKLAGFMAEQQRETDFFTFAIENQKMAQRSLWAIAGQMRDTFSSGVSTMFVDMIKGTHNSREAWANLGNEMLQILIDFMVQKTISAALGKVLLAGEVAASAAAGVAVAVAWANAAAMVSLATLGSNAAPASAGITATVGLAKALALPVLAEGGIVSRPTIAMIGEAGPEAIIPLNKNINNRMNQYFHIEINYPVVRSDEDIDRLTEEISLRLARETERL